MLNLRNQLWFRTAFAWIRLIHRDITQTDMLRQASAMAYVTLLSLVPSIAVSFSLLNYFLPKEQTQEIVDRLREILFSRLTEGAGEGALDKLQSMIDGLDPGAMGLTGFAGLTVSLILLLRQIEMSFNQIWRIRKHRNIFLRFLYFCGFLGMGVFVSSLGSSLLKNLGLRFLDPTNPEPGFWSGLTGAGIGFTFLLLLYRGIPNCKVHWRSAAVAAAFTVIAFSAARKGFVWYGSHIANYQMIYGALAALPLFLIWLYLCWVIVLLGAVLSRRIQTGTIYPDKHP